VTLTQGDLLTCGPGNAYAIGILGKETANQFDPDTGIGIAIRVRWNSGAQLQQFPPFYTSLHDPGVFYFLTGASLEVVYDDSLTWKSSYRPGTKSRIAPTDVATILSDMVAGEFAVLVCPMAVLDPQGRQGPLAGTVDPRRMLPGLTCRYRAPSTVYKPSLYLTHAALLRTGDEFRASVGAGGGVYTTPGQLASIQDGLTMTATADGDAGQVRWYYGPEGA